MSEINQEEFRKDITEVVNKHFNKVTEQSVDEVLEMFLLGYKAKYSIEDENVERITFDKALEQLINKYSMENGSDTPDFLLRDYLMNCLDNFDTITNRRNKFYGRKK